MADIVQKDNECFTTKPSNSKNDTSSRMNNNIEYKVVV